MAQHIDGADKVRILIDAREQGPQSQEVIHELNSLLSGPVHEHTKTAILTTSALLVLQTKRGGASSFHDEVEALNWLLA